MLRLPHNKTCMQFVLLINPSGVLSPDFNADWKHFHSVKPMREAELKVCGLDSLLNICRQGIKPHILLSGICLIASFGLYLMLEEKHTGLVSLIGGFVTRRFPVQISARAFVCEVSVSALFFFFFFSPPGTLVSSHSPKTYVRVTAYSQ